jgi:hypothetical protein
MDISHRIMWQIRCAPRSILWDWSRPITTLRRLPVRLFTGTGGSFRDKGVTRAVYRRIHQLLHRIDELLDVLHVVRLVRGNRYPPLVKGFDLHFAFEGAAGTAKRIRNGVRSRLDNRQSQDFSGQETYSLS